MSTNALISQAIFCTCCGFDSTRTPFWVRGPCAHLGPAATHSVCSRELNMRRATAVRKLNQCAMSASAFLLPLPPVSECDKPSSPRPPVLEIASHVLACCVRERCWPCSGCRRLRFQSASPRGEGLLEDLVCGVVAGKEFGVLGAAAPCVLLLSARVRRLDRAAAPCGSTP